MEKETESFKPPAKKSRSFDPHISLETENVKNFKDNTRLKHTDKLRGECTTENNADSPPGENAGIIERDENAPKIGITQDSFLVTSCSSSGSSLDSGIPDELSPDYEQTYYNLFAYCGSQFDVMNSKRRL